MPTKNLTTPFERDGVTQRSYKFGGGANTITTENGFFMDAPDPADPPIFVPYTIGYHINAGGGDDTIFGSDIGAPRSGIGDTLIGGDGSDTISGGLGDDTIYGGNEDGSDGGHGKNPVVSNTLYGDVNSIFLEGATVTGGNDVLTAGNDATNFMLGDARSVSGTGSFTGGNDTLIGGTGNDTMTGDWASSGGVPTLTGGEDTFVFKLDGGKDTVRDFRGTDSDGDASNGVGDKIVLDGFGLTYDTTGNGVFDFADLSITQSGPNQFLIFDADNQITFFDVEFHVFTADDFVFV